MKNNVVFGTVFNIQRFTVHDGPGIRTEIFLKGCPLNCKWCSNPECFDVHPQIGVFSNRCLGSSKCNLCADSCSENNTLVFENGKVTAIDYEKCTSCFKCIDACPTDALKKWGDIMSSDEVVNIVNADRDYYKNNGGGVTISGGEALLQWEFTKAIVERCKGLGIHTCVESALSVKTEILLSMMPGTDLFITDIKHLDNDEHMKYTGVGVELILKNIKILAESGKPYVLRLPVIPGVNDSVGYIARVADFISNELKNTAVQVQLLRFRRLGEEKYKSLGLPYQMTEINPEREMYENHIKDLVKILSEREIPAFAGTTNKIRLKNKDI